MFFFKVSSKTLILRFNIEYILFFFKNGRITYEFVWSDSPCPLIVNPNTGELVLAGSLDYEKNKIYRIRIRAIDHGIPPKSAIMDLILNVYDVNDNSPIFEQKLYNFEV